MPEFRFEVLEPGIAQLRLTRPKSLNSLSDQGVAALGACLDEAAQDNSLRVLILTGEGRAFCSGFDLGLADEAPESQTLGEAAAWTRRQEAFAALVTKMRALPQVVIAAVNGPAYGAGLGLALAAEIRIASRAASFCAAFVKVGMSGCDIGVSWLLPRHIGLSRAFEMMLTGREVGAEEASQQGLVSKLVKPEELQAEALQMARSIRAHSSFAIWMTKRGVWANAEAVSLQAAIELENRTQILTRTTGDLARAALARKKLIPGQKAITGSRKR
jgi:enoyl-CoA hydratase